ncbi:hypothetical protein OsJ_11832 [Oryza sativa Japonica Group]|uniref:Uncharacterized protein n=1 Tax=Oryza sativa subsp. japonica TaxID=39947 RepID=B9F9V5_ORYSJ|nr:hypothetical protein OsJ_11832 [Oryza sativa Japonica Group]
MGDWPSAGARLGDGRGEAGHRGEALARARPAIRKRRRPGALVNRRRATPRFARTEATRLYMTANARSRLHPSYPCGYLGNSICRVSAGHSTPKRGVGCPPARARSGTGREPDESLPSPSRPLATTSASARASSSLPLPRNHAAGQAKGGARAPSATVALACPTAGSTQLQSSSCPLRTMFVHPQCSLRHHLCPRQPPHPRCCMEEELRLPRGDQIQRNAARRWRGGRASLGKGGGATRLGERHRQGEEEGE